MIRGEEGCFRVAGAWRFQGSTSVKQVELLAVRVGLRLAKRVCVKVQVETEIDLTSWLLVMEVQSTGQLFVLPRLILKSWCPILWVYNLICPS